MAVIGALLLALGVIGTVGSILFGGVYIGQWAMAASVAFVIVGVIGALVIGGRRS
ncbi:hypothetical protein [Rhodococcus triatomae]